MKRTFIFIIRHTKGCLKGLSFYITITMRRRIIYVYIFLMFYVSCFYYVDPTVQTLSSL